MASNLYRPPNGTESMTFMELFCVRCIKDDYNHGVYCPILGNTMMYQVTDPEYPKEWVYGESYILGDEDGPRCTAFEARDGE